MTKHPFESEYLYGLHDPGGERLMAAAGKPGWVLVSEAIDSDANDHGGSHTNYAALANSGFGIIVRLNNGYYGPGTLPHSSQYGAFAQRCANYVRHLPQVHIWIIGNEMNMLAERPGARIDWSRGAARGLDDESGDVPSEDDVPSPREMRRQLSVLAPTTRGGQPHIIDPGETITPSMYVGCYTRCRRAIRGVPGHEQDLVLMGAVAPWNDNTGDWIDYFRQMLTQLGPGGCDGISLHTYTHGVDPSLIDDPKKMDPPYDNYHYNFRTYQDFMHAIPHTMRHLPVYITETDQDGEWADRGDSTWIQRAYGEIDWWNKQPGHQQIRTLILYRWETHDRFALKGKGGVAEDFRRSLQHDYRWQADAAPQPDPDPSPVEKPPVELVTGQQAFIAGTVNIRRAPGYRNQADGDVLGQLIDGTPVTVLDGPQLADDLRWWRVRSQFPTGAAVEGWVAQVDPNGDVLLRSA